MIVLAIETATIEVAAGVGDGSGLRAAVTARPGRRHAETLHPAIAQACRFAGVELAEIQAVAVDVGPGLFTGLRVGVAAAKAMAAALGVPAVGISSLEILARAARAGLRPVVPVVDVRRGEIAWLLPGESSEPRLGSPAALAAELSGPGGSGTTARWRGAEGPVLLVGDGARRYGEELLTLLAAGSGADHGPDAGGRSPGSRPPEGSPSAGGSGVAGPVAAPARFAIGGDLLAAPPVGALLELAGERLAEGLAGDPSGLVPRYLREADARINWATRPHAEPAYDS
ncbi:MAG TPA: tRNA (adenosine(37)-N6)-threonylcarbamoyltransferase complex dimerization subunit type 1 TsaB [Acidimicrobiales bacterium]|nr:tRNA (adenosine(37)-N6)-threonylcarbamoyltransferase complex dimerization subunit type 1 TsaB [Acidimicrobiales bacterium]